MRVAIDGRSIKDKPSGVGIWNLRLIVQLLKNSQADIYLIVPKNCTYNFKNDPSLNPHLGKRLNIVDSKYSYTFIGARRFIFEQLELPRLLSSLNIDIYHATDSFGIPFFISSRIKTVLTCHDLIPYTPYREYMNSFQFFLYMLSIKISFAKADKLIAVSDQTREDILSFIHPKKNVEVVYNGIDKPTPIPGKQKALLWEQLSQSYGIKSNNYVFYFGGFGPRKNVLSVIETFIFLKNNRDIPASCKLVLCGRINKAKQASLDILQSLKEVAEKNGITESMVILDYVSEEDKQLLIENSLICLFFYLYEGFGFSPIEIIQRNKILLFTKTGIWKSYVEENMLLIDDPLSNQTEINKRASRVLEAPKRIQDQSLELLRKFVSQFSFEKMGKEYLEIYKEITSQKSS